MNKNIGTLDRALRIGFGVLVLGLGFYFKTWWGALGLVPLVTGVINWCPLYTILGTNSCCAKHE